MATLSLFDPVQLLAAHEAPAQVGVPAGTVRRWASEMTSDGLPVLAPRGLDHRDHPLYAKADLEALRDRPRRAAHVPVVDRVQPKPNTEPAGTRVSTGAR